MGTDVEKPNAFVSIRALLAALGMRVSIARDGAEAVRHAQSSGFDCVFLGAYMPDQHRASFQEIIRAVPRAPVFVLTAGISPAERQQMSATGVRACLLKPIGEQEMAKLLSVHFLDR